METTQVSINRELAKEEVIFYNISMSWTMIHHEKKEILPFVTTWMNLEGICE